jgi:hypothetical protein
MFQALVQEQAIPWRARLDGRLGYFAGEPLVPDTREFMMISLWRDLPSLAAFVGENWQPPVVTTDEAPLIEAMTADHYLGKENRSCVTTPRHDHPSHRFPAARLTVWILY